ncbi:cysteine desulfurase [Ruminococcus sp. AF43-11]|nr:cysteine desulfurase family protein [Ruminococcus sp. AF43-11]RGF38691.1 cysteine desulfurase [Ruminococcus sp. AF43-11]
MIYLDNAATSPVDVEVLEAMLPYLKEEYGNPSSKYYCKAENAKIAVENAREKVAGLIGALPEEIIFTAGASESTNFIIKGYLDYNRYYGDGRNQVITSNAEHKATLNVCKYLNGDIYSNNDSTVSLFEQSRKVDRGYSAVFLGINENGVVCPDLFGESITDRTALASFIYVNNEIGSINDVKALSEIAHRHNVLMHLDATQALGKTDVDVRKINCDFLSASAHKIYGPKGVGCAYIKADNYGLPPMSAFIHGGEQEKGLRAGTLAVHNIVGFGKAAEIALRDKEVVCRKIAELDDYLTDKLKGIPEISIICGGNTRVKGIISLLVNKDNFNNERFIKRISDKCAVSTGSACSAGAPSHVISAIGLKNKVSKIIRLSLNKFTTKNDIDDFLSVLLFALNNSRS